MDVTCAAKYFMNKILRLFPVVMLEGIIENHEEINQRLTNEIEQLFAGLQEKRVLSYKWSSNIYTQEKHQSGYTSFIEGESLTEKENFNFFHQAISTTIEGFFQQLNFLGDWHFVNSWVSIYPKGAFIPLHDHSPMQWSGVYYVAAHENCGEIWFTDPKEYALQNEPKNTDYRDNFKYKIIPKSGMLLLFPSYLKHETLPNEQDQDRIIISFNINTDVKS
jgi:uncharacterized protein (TIGR02466 family)